MPTRSEVAAKMNSLGEGGWRDFALQNPEEVKAHSLDILGGFVRQNNQTVWAKHMMRVAKDIQFGELQIVDLDMALGAWRTR